MNMTPIPYDINPCYLLEVEIFPQTQYPTKCIVNFLFIVKLTMFFLI